jgi:hypothetical protein
MESSLAALKGSSWDYKWVREKVSKKRSKLVYSRGMAVRTADKKVVLTADEKVVL